MPYYAKSEDWLHQSALLLQARPSTTRITTRYHLKPAHNPTKAERVAAKNKNNTDTTVSTTTNQQAQQTSPDSKALERAKKPPRGHLVLTTFDPASGVSLKYKTSKAAEVGRLVQMLGALGRRMAGVDLSVPAAPGSGSAAKSEDEVMGEAPPAMEREASGSGGVQTPVAVAGSAGAAGGVEKQQQGEKQGGGGGGGKGKKKKGKR
ncbi:hypothetical protein VTI74DRAFT_7676 [Chaetomium olivicolor]